MIKERFVTSQFCDDIRHEVGFKFSLMGCYSSELIVDDYPVVLSKLCALVTARSPVEWPFTKLCFRAKLDNEVIAEVSIPDEVLLEQQNNATKSAMDGAKYIAVSAMMVFSPLVLNEEGLLRIEAETEDGIIQSTALVIRNRRETDPPAFQQTMNKKPA